MKYTCVRPFNLYGGNDNFSIVDKQTNSSFFTFSASIDLLSHLDGAKIILGESATQNDEIMITSALANSFFKSSLFDYDKKLAQSFGIWEVEDLLKEKILKDNNEYKIS